MNRGSFDFGEDLADAAVGLELCLERPQREVRSDELDVLEGEHADRHPLVVRRLTWFEPHPCVELAWQGVGSDEEVALKVDAHPERERTTGLTSLDQGHGEHEPEARTCDLLQALVVEVDVAGRALQQLQVETRHATRTSPNSMTHLRLSAATLPDGELEGLELRRGHLLAEAVEGPRPAAGMPRSSRYQLRQPVAQIVFLRGLDALGLEAARSPRRSR